MVTAFRAAVPPTRYPFVKGDEADRVFVALLVASLLLFDRRNSIPLGEKCEKLLSSQIRRNEIHTDVDHEFFFESDSLFTSSYPRNGSRDT